MTKKGYVAIATVKHDDHGTLINCAEDHKGHWFTREAKDDTVVLQFSFNRLNHLLKWIDMLMRRKIKVQLDLSTHEE